MTLNHHREGTGPPLVLIHGIGLSWRTWRPVLGPLAREFDVIACDSPGFGESPPLPAGTDPTIHAHADAYERFFAELRLERPHVAGNSMGGAISLELARRGTAGSATAISPAGFWTDRELRFCQLSLGALGTVPTWLRPAVRALVETRPGRFALFWQTYGHPTRLPAGEAVAAFDHAWTSPVFTEALEALSRYRFSPGRMQAPVTVAWGRHDRLLLYGRQAPRARALLPAATHVTLGTGHVPCLDDPAAVVEVIRSRAA